MTSSRLTSFLERASFTDAFNYNRRLGIAVALLDPKDDRYTLTAGLFGQEINNASFNRTGWQASVRGTFAPEVGDARLHLGANLQHRVAQRDAQNVQYRASPFTQVTDQRFVEERNSLREAVEATIKEDAKGNVSSATKKRLTSAIAAFRAKFVKTIPDFDTSYPDAEQYFVTLGSLTSFPIRRRAFWLASVEASDTGASSASRSFAASEYSST